VLNAGLTRLAEATRPQSSVPRVGSKSPAIASTLCSAKAMPVSSKYPQRRRFPSFTPVVSSHISAEPAGTTRRSACNRWDRKPVVGPKVDVGLKAYVEIGQSAGVVLGFDGNTAHSSGAIASRSSRMLKANKENCAAQPLQRSNVGIDVDAAMRVH
jgi:hypothetical protein